jgi:hypothetical protein
MNYTKKVVAVAGLLSLVMPATGAHAVSGVGFGTRLLVAAEDTAFVEKIASRHCWRHHGRQHCSLYGGARVLRHQNGGSGYYEHDSSSLPFGSQRWWDQMLRENRLNSGGGLN